MDKQSEKQFKKLEVLKSSIITLFQDTPENILNRNPFENKWSPLQILYHVIRAEQATLIALKRTLKDYNSKEALGFLAPLISLQLKFLFSLPLKFKAPKGVDIIPENPDFGDLIKKWDGVRKDMSVVLQTIPANALNKNLFSTWYSNKMNVHHILVFLVLHSKRHSRQIKNLIRSS